MKWSMWQSVTRPRNRLRKSCEICEKTIWMHSQVCPTCEYLREEIEIKSRELANDEELLSEELDRIYKKYSLSGKEEEE